MKKVSLIKNHDVVYHVSLFISGPLITKGCLTSLRMILTRTDGVRQHWRMHLTCWASKGLSMQRLSSYLVHPSMMLWRLVHKNTRKDAVYLAYCRISVCKHNLWCTKLSLFEEVNKWRNKKICSLCTFVSNKSYISELCNM